MEKKEVNLSEIDAAFVISSFKNKERRNNPSMLSRPLLPPGEVERMEKEKAEAKKAGDVFDIATDSGEPDEVDMDNTGSKSDRPDNEGISDRGNVAVEAIIPAGSTKRTTTRQRKAAFEEYQELFLKTPKIVNRKPVFISESTRERLNKIARKLGDDNMSASGFLENLARHHLDMYNDDVEMWKKL